MEGPSEWRWECEETGLGWGWISGVVHKEFTCQSAEMHTDGGLEVKFIAETHSFVMFGGSNCGTLKVVAH